VVEDVTGGAGGVGPAEQYQEALLKGTVA
jgi:hypothetical protein